MKNRVISMLVLIIMILLMICSCQSGNEKNKFTESNDQSGQNTIETPSQEFVLNLKEVKPYQPLVCGFSDSVSSVSHEIEYDFADKEKYSEVIPSEKLSVNIGGEMYEGELRSTEYIGNNYFPTYRYSAKEWGQPGSIDFKLDENSNLIGFMRPITSGDEKICSEQECLQIAKDFLSQYVDISQYQIQTKLDEDYKCYSYSFIKYLGDFRTDDMAKVDVDFEGVIYSFSSCMLGRIPIETETNDIDMDKVHSCAKERLDEMYLPAKDKFDEITYGDSSYYLTILKDGKRGICYDSEIELINQVNTTGSQPHYLIMGERIVMMIPLD